MHKSSVVGCKIPRKENSPVFLFFWRPPPLPVSPGVHPRLTRRWIETCAPDKKSGWLTLLAGSTRKKASTRRVNRKIADSMRNQRVFFSRYLAANYELNEYLLKAKSPPRSSTWPATEYVKQRVSSCQCLAIYRVNPHQIRLSQQALLSTPTQLLKGVLQLLSNRHM